MSALRQSVYILYGLLTICAGNKTKQHKFMLYGQGLTHTLTRIETAHWAYFNDRCCGSQKYCRISGKYKAKKNVFIAFYCWRHFHFYARI